LYLEYNECIYTHNKVVIQQIKEGFCMQQDQKNADSTMKPKFSAGTNAQKVKQEIKQDVMNGQGAMTSREAGAMRD